MDMKEFEKKVDEFIKSFSKEEMIEILKENGFEVIENEENGKWKPKGVEQYWYRRNDTGEMEKLYRYEGDGWDDYRVNNEPVFKTLEECEKYWEFRDALKEKSYEFSEKEWKNENIFKFNIYYSNLSKCNAVDYDVYNKRLGSIYFKTEKDAQYIIDNYKEELLKYWL